MSETRPMQSLVASAVRLAGRSIRRVRHEKWQYEAWEMRDLLGEVRFPAVMTAKALSKATFFAAEVSDDETADPEPVTEGVPFEAMRALGGSRAGRSQLVRRIGEQLFVVGESYLVGIPPSGVSDVSLADLRWEVASAEEISGSSKDAQLVDEHGHKLEDAKLTIRVWQPHPRRWWEADSPVRSSLPVLRELVGLTKHVSAQIDQRLAGAGVLAISDGASVVVGDDGGEVSLIDAFMEATIAPIENRDQASALVPLLMTVAGKASDAIHHVKFWSELDKEARPLREEAIRRWAIGADIPAELLTGVGQTNHWTSFLLADETVRTHLEPILALIADALTTQYLWPVLEEAGVDDFKRFVVWFGTSELVRRTNRSESAMALFEQGLLSGAAVRREAGFDDGDAPEPLTARQRALEIAMGAVQQSPSILNVLSIPDLVEQLGQVLDAVPPEDAPRDNGDASEVDGGDVEVPDTEPDDGVSMPEIGEGPA